MVQSAADGALFAVVDGAGHGVEAAAAARAAADILEAHADESPVSLVLRCHEELRATRGAAMTLAFLNLRDRTLTWLGVGNVEAVLFHASTHDNQTAERVLLRSGLVGYRLPARLRAEVIPLKHQDTLIMATDGIAPEFAEGLAPEGHPQHLAERILARHGSGRDDALVAVARYLKGPTP
jgi:negative regulator of sigma-B (phosphoserine phosphatase)